MRASRRQFLIGGGLAGLAMMTTSPGWAADSASGLTPMTGNAKPISTEERLGRIARVQELMRAQDIAALLVEAGSSLLYFTGIDWWRSERLTAAVIPADGDVLIVTPGFEEPSIRESLAVPGDVQVWQEDENPIALIGDFLRRRKLDKGAIAIEETVRFFAVDGLRHALPDARIVSGAPVVRGCRMIKSPAELALMQVAADIQIAAFRHIAPRIERGMSQQDIQAMLIAASRALGGESDGGLILIGESSAYPHGSHTPRRVADGEVILFDAGVTVHGYQSDISRTMVYGRAADARQRQLFDQVRRGQDIAMETAQVGTPAGKVDDAVRAYYATLGYGPGYKLPGTPHRTGHGIGMDGHEPVNLVHGEATPLAPGMCFSNEPGIYIPGAFGVRIEDCFHMTAEGPRWFTRPPASIDRPFDIN
ncbi:MULTISPECIES: M24 family metallopeptidase [unclassified Sphingomonas]|uniref:M24 family metallopeptidase n=1 Tax=unclassified Sphingomonas TaxID=196159 RepID=UPI0006FD480C|nr:MULTISPECIES: Xaa-Pro peptidase family protein [unclassified Sphingomonas]KQX18012.1 peptidase [Sphingomonas sp. Root1294]KQY70937.1 peptidase [Sphingomonas sp. Root50]KRB91565.1 peptidase [Sphingomonas sp. Root720]